MVLGAALWAARELGLLIVQPGKPEAAGTPVLYPGDSAAELMKGAKADGRGLQAALLPGGALRFCCIPLRPRTGYEN